MILILEWLTLNLNIYVFIDIYYCELATQITSKVTTSEHTVPVMQTINLGNAKKILNFFQQMDILLFILLVIQLPSTYNSYSTVPSSIS